MTDERELDRLVRELESLREAVIDASSMIYLEKGGVLESVADELELFSVPQAAAETGFEFRSIKLIDAGLGCADDALLTLAVKRRYPLLSEDRKLLLRAERNGVRYYNTLILLALLLLRSRLSQEGYDEAIERLRTATRYSRRVCEYGKEVARYVMMNR